MRTKVALVVLILTWTLASHLLSEGSSKSSHPSSQEANPPQVPSARTLRIAIVQMHSLDHDIEGNLKRATKFSEQGAAQGATLVLFPELMATGSYLSFNTWDSAEPSNGKTVQWLKSTSRRLHIYLGAGFFEADGDDFYDTFVLTTPEGEEAGKVRKALPAEAEAYFLGATTIPM